MLWLYVQTENRSTENSLDTIFKQNVSFPRWVENMLYINHAALTSRQSRGWFCEGQKAHPHAFKLANTPTPIPGSPNHHVMPPCVERGRPHKLFSLRHRQESSACWAKGQSAKACQKLIKPRYLLKESKLWVKKIHKTRQKECRGTALQQLPYNWLICTSGLEIPV